MRRPIRPIHMKVFGSTLVFLGLAIASAAAWIAVERLFPKKIERGPTSVLYNEDDELVMEEVDLQELRKKNRGKGSRWNAVFTSAPGNRGIITNPNEISRLTGTTTGLRARAVVFEPSTFNRFVTASERRVPFDLFDDVHFEVRFGPTPTYGPNTGVFSGSIDSDPEARVHLFVSGQNIGGTIETSKRIYRILDGGQGLHYIVEERLSKR